MVNRKKILLITGSMNQTTQMIGIANQLKDYDCWFSQLFTDNRIINFLINKTRLLDGTVISKPFKAITEQYLKDNHCKIDYKAKLNQYDLVIFCSDMLVPKRMLQQKTVWVQEGMIDKITWISYLIKLFKLPSMLSFNTSLNGTSNKCDLYCTASKGYKEYITKMGTDASKVVVTGIPNYDNAKQYLDNDFPLHGYVMVATSDMRETARFENRPAFIKKCVAVANGRQLLFKLHPNEDAERAIKEIRQNAPEDTMIFTDGNTQEMIANCEELITQYSTVVYTGISLGKKVHSFFDVERLYKLAPVQNDGNSAKHIAVLCSGLITQKSNIHSMPVYKPQHADSLFDSTIKNERVYAG
jgi:hypothetical protein